MATCGTPIVVLQPPAAPMRYAAGFVIAFSEHIVRVIRALRPTRAGGQSVPLYGYRPIRDAALALGPAPAGEFRDRLQRPAPRIDADRLIASPSDDVENARHAFNHPLPRSFGRLGPGLESHLRGCRWTHLVSSSVASA